jgi:alkylhydroperoxidase family enzyme
MTAADASALRDEGFTDADIHDAAQVVSYFSYINRIADGLGVEPEPEWGDEPYADLM